MMTWIEARRELREEIERWESVEITAHGRRLMPRPDPHCLNNTKYSKEHRTVVAISLSMDAIKECSSLILNNMLVGLDDPDTLVRRIIEDALGVCGYIPAVPGLVRLLKNTNDSAERENIGLALTAIGKSAVPALLDLGIDIHRREGGQAKENIVFIEAWSAIINMGPDVVDWLLEMFLDEKTERWLMTLPILASHYKTSAEQKFMKMLRDPIHSSNQTVASRIDDAYKHFFVTGQ